FYIGLTTAVTFNDLPPEILHLIARDLDTKPLSPGIPIAKDQTANIFLYAVTRTPRLASYVRSLNLKCRDTKNADSEIDPQRVGFDDNLVHKILSERMGYFEEERSKWLKDLERDNSDAWLALLIPQLNELRKLSLT
ncbi:hypothetical protein N7449_007203, partial [Penicillium cf. viridicatum]